MATITELKQLETTGISIPIPTRRPSGPGARKKVKVFIAEEQEILTGAYRAFWGEHRRVEVVGSSRDTDGLSLQTVAEELKPRVMLVGIKVLQPQTIEALEDLRSSHPEVAVVLLFAWFNGKGMEALREFSRRSTTGSAYLFKHSIDTEAQLSQVIESVAEGRIILDPVVMEGLISGDESKASLIKDLSRRELDVLTCMAKGFRNDRIARELCIELKTVERYINSIYSKLDDCPETKHTRVHAVTTYFKAMGKLVSEDLLD